FAPIAPPETSLPVTRAAYAFDESVALKGPLIAAALLLLLLATLAVLWLAGRLSRRPAPSRATATATGVAVAIVAGGLVLLVAGPSQAQDMQAGDEVAIAAITETRIAYVLTGNGSIDSVSRAGLQGLSRYLV